MTHIICQCNHATEFAVQINQDTLNSLDNFFNKPSLQELLELSAATIKMKAFNSQAFTLALQKNILSKVSKAVLEYKIQRINYWPIVISITILVLFILIYPCLNFLQTIKKDYFASWEPETLAAPKEEESQQDTKIPKTNSFKQAKNFWSFYALVYGRYEKFLTNNLVRTASFYTEVLNLIGNVLLWTLFFNSRSQSSTALTYLYVPLLAVCTSSVSYYLALGLLNYCKIRSLKKFHLYAEKGLIYRTSRLVWFENIQLLLCVIIIIGWLVLFGAFSTILADIEALTWLGCSALAVVISYGVIDSILVLLYFFKKWKKLFLLLALRSLSSEYIA